jgi:hypothetical protein
VLIPLLAGGLIGAVFGNMFGQVKGFTYALMPLTMDPNLEASYRKAVGHMTPENQRDFDDLLHLAARRREQMARGGFIPLYHDMPIPEVPPAATGALFTHHGYRPGPPAFAPYGYVTPPFGW